MNTQFKNSGELLTFPLKSSTLSNYYPWTIVFLCSLFLFYKYVLQISPSVMTQDLMRTYHVAGAGLGNLAATFFYAYLVTQIIAGLLLDRLSPRYLTTLAIGSAAMGSLIFAYSHSLLTAELSRGLMGAGAAFATVSYMKMSALWFRNNQMAFVDGLLATAAMAGAMCGQIPLTALVNAVGWRDSVLYCGLFGVLLACLFFVFVKDKKQSTLQTNTASTVHGLLTLLKSKKNWLLTFYSGLAFTPVAVLGGLWGNPFFEESHHLTNKEAAFFTSLVFLGLAVGGPLFGFFADRLGNRIKVMAYGSGLAFATLVFALYALSLPLWLFGSLLFLFGLGSGAFMLSYPLGKELNQQLGLAATVIALINTGDAFFGSFTEPLIGKVLDFFWQGKIVAGVHYFSITDYDKALIILPVYLLGALGCLMALKKMQ